MIRLTSDQSHYVLQALIVRGRLRASEALRTLKNRDREIRELRDRLASLESLGALPVRSVRRGSRKGRLRHRVLSSRVRALRRLQGRYMGFVRRLKPSEKARVRVVKEKRGLEAAIRLASSLAKKK